LGGGFGKKIGSGGGVCFVKGGEKVMEKGGRLGGGGGGNKRKIDSHHKSFK